MTGASSQTPPKCGNSAVIRMDSYEDKNPQGTLYLLHTQEEIAFTNLFELLEQLDRLAQCSERGHPAIQAYSGSSPENGKMLPCGQHRRYGATLQHFR